MSLFDEDETDLDALAEQLRSSDPADRRVAVVKLVDSPAPEAEGMILGLLGDADAGVRETALRGLDGLDGAAIIAGLVAALADPEPALRAIAAEILATRKAVEGMPLLVERITHPDGFIRAAVLHALIERRFAPALAPALAALGDAETPVRREAASVLGWLQNPQAVPGLVTATLDEDAEVRRHATGALVFARDSEAAATAVIARLSDSDWQVRQEAADASARMGLKPAIPALIAAMADPYWQVRVKAANSLGKLRGAEAVAVLGQALGHDISNLRKEAAAALGEIAEPSARLFLEPYADDPDPDVRKLVRWALSRLPSASR